MQRRHLLQSLAVTALVGLNPHRVLAASNEFEWVHPGGDPYDPDGTQPLLPALHILNKDGFIPPWAVAELEGKMSRGDFFSDSIPNTGDYLFHRMLFSHRKVTVARNVRARTQDAGWVGITRELRVYVASQGGLRYYAVLPRVCGNLAVRRVEYGRCVPDDRLCDANCIADQSELQRRQYNPTGKFR